MVASKSSTNPNKRKKGADMPDSPPKRVTRSRAKVAEAPEPEPPIKSARIKTASAKAAVSKVSMAKATKAKPVDTTKRKTRADDAADNVVTDQPMDNAIEQDEPEVPKTRGRRKKVVEGVEMAAAPVIAPASKSRTRSEKPNLDSIELSAAAKATAPTTKATRATASSRNKVESGKTATKVTKKVTRGATTASNDVKSSTLAISKAPIARKKVTFQETTEQDKENQPVPALKKSGIAAKPIRKPAPAKSAARKGKAVPAGEAGKEPATEQAKPLSPKKVLQVAKSFSSEDEFAGEKTPVKLLSQSPRKPPSSVLRETSDTDGNTALDASPTRVPAASSIMASPARRPPPLPFKGAIKDSPKRFDFGSTKKLGTGPSAAITSVLQPDFTLKASLIQSPAKRPTSPTKFFAPISPSKTLTVVEPVQASDPSHHSPLKVTRFTPHKISSTPLRAAQALARSVQPQDLPISQRISEIISPLESIENAVTGEDLIEESTTPPGTPQLAFLGAQSVSVTPTPAKPVHETSAESLMEDAAPSQVKQEDESSILTSNAGNQQAGDQQAGVTEASPESSPQRWTKNELPSAFRLNYADPRLRLEESDSEDELQSTFKPRAMQPNSFDSAGTPTPAAFPRKCRSTLGRSSFHTTMTRTDGNASMTPLAAQLSSWLASSPDKKAPRISQTSTRNASSPVGLRLFGQIPQPSSIAGRASPFKTTSPLKSSFFEDEMMAFDQDETVTKVYEDYHATGMDFTVQDATKDSFESHASTEADQYGDENAMPIDPQILQVETTDKVEVPAIVETCTPARIFYSNPREVHTVSKVPLRPPADDSPELFTRKRSRSLSSPSKSRGIFKNSMPLSSSVENANMPKSPEKTVLTEITPELGLTPQKSDRPVDPTTPVPITPFGSTWSSFATPMRSVRKGVDAQILRGAVVHVDVHTTEGADASAIFVELLSSMGARCVKKWNWNPRASLGSSLDTATDGQDLTCGAPNGKVGITHVVFKDGGKRTLEKVRESQGLVSCVGVGWVLDCEQQNRWVEESEYAVDLSLVPRGGHRRRKSMEPGRLSNFNGSLVPADFIPTKSVGSDMSPTKEFLNLSSPPASRRETLGPDSPIFHQQFLDASQADIMDDGPVTPRPETPLGNGGLDAESSFGSPTTPFYLGKEADLLQRTCPPKQKFQSILQGDDDDEERVRQRLIQARRKTLQWAPRVESPLGRWGGN